MQACQQFIKLFQRLDFVEVDLSGDNGGREKVMIHRLSELRCPSHVSICFRKMYAGIVEVFGAAIRRGSRMPG
jgi:hypothetical protein